MGGTDDPSNIVELTVEEHAQAHYDLWIEHGREFDRLAYIGLSGQIGKEELMKKVLTEFGKKGTAVRIANSTPEQRSEWSRLGGKANWEKNREKLVESAKVIFTKASKRKIPCPQGCGQTFNPGNLARHLRGPKCPNKGNVQK